MVRSILLVSALLAACSPFSGEQSRAAPSATATAVTGDKSMYLTDSFNGSGLLHALSYRSRRQKPSAG